MSDSSETSSVSGEWDLSLESSNEIVKLKEEMKSMEEETAKKLAEMQKKLEEMEIKNDTKQREEDMKNEGDDHMTSKSANMGNSTIVPDSTTTPAAQENNKNLPIDSFLGTYSLVNGNVTYASTHTIVAIVIRKATIDGYFSICWISDKRQVFRQSFIPDNVPRNGDRAWIDGTVLNRTWGQDVSRYQLTDSGLILGSDCDFVRV